MSNNGKEEVLDIFEPGDEAEEFYTSLDEDREAELAELIGVPVVGLELWETSLGDDEAEGPIAPENRSFFDVDLLFDGGTALELYVASVYPDPNGEAVTGLDAIYDVIGRLSDDELQLLDFDQADEEGGLALAFGKDNQTQQVVVASAWMVSEWEPEEADEEEEEV